MFTIPRVARIPQFAGDHAVWLLTEIEAAAHDALPAFGLRATRRVRNCCGNEIAEWVLAGPPWAAKLAAERENPACEVARQLLQSFRNAETVNFTIGGARPISLEAPLVMAAVNVTPDSFSDGGDFLDPEAATAAAMAAVEAGARIVDIGGESTRPGARPVAPGEEIARVIPVIRNIKNQRPEIVISIDTIHAETASAAAEAGATIINDVSAFGGDPRMAETAARLGLPVILGHMRGTPATMNDYCKYTDVVVEVMAELESAVAAACAAGVARDRILIDPGFGFAKNSAQNVEMLRRLFEFRSLGLPIVVGTSRKRFLGEILGGRPPKERDDATTATVVIAARAGARICRVHNARAAADALSVISQMEKPGG